jgi:beta-glucanase (GH16 family)
MMKAVSVRLGDSPGDATPGGAFMDFKRISKSTMLAALILFVASCGGSNAGSNSTTPPSNPPQWQLVWSDEFNGANGSSPDPSNWTFDLGGSGWGNEELESYTNRTANTHIQDGNLAITAVQETYTGLDGITRPYTSARLKTQGLFSQAYGKFEARIKIPYGQGMWPAFWMLGSDFGQVPWPNSGEIDIMENIGKEPSTIHGTVHGPGYSDDAGIAGEFTLPGAARFSDDFHIFAVEWEPAQIRFYVDGTLYKTVSTSDLPAGTQWVFNHPFFIILNVAVGGSWPGNPDPTTVFPQTMLVDYVRVYKNVAP